MYELILKEQGLKFKFIGANDYSKAKILEYVNTGGENETENWINSADYEIDNNIINCQVDFENQCYCIIETLH